MFDAWLHIRNKRRGLICRLLRTRSTFSGGCTIHRRPLLRWLLTLADKRKFLLSLKWFHIAECVLGAVQQEVYEALLALTTPTRHYKNNTQPQTPVVPSESDPWYCRPT